MTVNSEKIKKYIVGIQPSTHAVVV